jgi:hypothetical protein
MRDIPQNVRVRPAPMMGRGARMVQLGCDQFEAALRLQTKRIERDSAAVQHACEAFQHARSYDVGTFARTWQTLVREYLATSVALWDQNLAAAARGGEAFGALLRDVYLDAEKFWVRAQLQVIEQAAPVPHAGDWMAYLGQFMGTRADGEAKPAEPESRAATAHA